ncbi:MAG: cytochrome c3 family protein [Opitutaceae bacterium]
MLFHLLRSGAIAAAFVSLICLFSGCGDSNDAGYEPTKGTNRNDIPAFAISHNPARQAVVGPDACAKCHEDAVTDWKKSHHAKANRPVSIEHDRGAFTPARYVEESGVTYELAENNGKFELRVLEEGESPLVYDLVGVIGYTPLRQYLAELPGNKFQTISATYDVIEDRWLDVYAGQDRMPGEWGHWAGQGMNWNSNCAYCHTTEYQKGFNFESNSYDPNWIQQGIACAECHTGLEDHIAEAQSENYTSKPIPDKVHTIQNCATCHSRRDQLTADAYKFGDAYDDHFTLSLPDQPDLYHPDGQIIDEDFVYGSFQMSRMAHAGVSCMDCHNPHTLEHILPVENNMLCMRCHEAGGTMEAPIIKPTEHSFHPAGSTGNRCVECHMPQTTYMQIDDRADHGFHSPDPLMTQELGIPNACSKCHSDESVDWAVEYAEKWYGEKLAQSRQRQRARAIAAAYAMEPEGMPALLAVAEGEEIPAWRATYAGLLASYLPNIEVVTHLKTLLDDESALVRGRAVRSLGQMPENKAVIIDKLGDNSRSVRIAASMALASQGLDVPDAQVAEEWQNYINFNMDRPQSLLLMANKAARDGNPAEVQKYVVRAVLLDSLNPEMYHQAAILLSSAGLNDPAARYLNTGWELAPENPMFPYSLGLLAAEAGELERAAGYLEETVAMEPQFYRAWYNLSLAYRQLNRMEDAQRAERKSQGL